MTDINEIYSVKCLFMHTITKDDDTKVVYEERITIWMAKDENEALKSAEDEALEYAQDCSGDDGIKIKFIGYQMCYSTQCNEFENGLEIYSLLRDSDLEPAQYLDKFYDTGSEYARTFNAQQVAEKDAASRRPLA